MTNVLKSKIAKAGLGLVVALGLMAGASNALALTASDIAMLQAAGIISASQAASLMAGATTTTTSTSCYQFTTALSVGSRGAAVTALQERLSISPATGYFGNLTKAAVAAYQTSNGLAAVGQVGPATRAKLNATCTSTTTPVTPTPTQTGPVAAMLATDNPASGTLVATQATADLAHFAFSGTGVVTNVTLQRIGVSADSTPSNVYLFDGATRLTDAASVSNNGMVTFNNPSGIFTVGGMKTIKVKSDIATGTSGQTLGMKLVSFTVSGSTTATAANVSGNIHSIASATLATVGAGTVTPSGATLNPGSNVTLWQSTLTVGERDVMAKRLAFRQVGSAPSSAFQNFKLYVNGTQVATAAGMDVMGYVTFDLSSAPVTLAAGSRVVRVDADVVSGASRTVQLSLRQAADADFVDSSFGVNVTPTSTPWAASAASYIGGTTGGTLTIEKDVSSPSTNLTLGGNDLDLGTFKVTAYGEAMKIETLRATFTSSDGTVGSLRNGRILVNGVQYGSSSTLLEDSTTPGYTSYTLNYTVMPGTPVMISIHADAYDNDGTNNLTAADTILAKIATGSSNVTRVDSLGSFSSPAADVSANTLTVAAASLTLTKNSTYANQNTTLPATNFKIGSWNLAGSSVEDVLLTTLSFDVDEVVSTEFDEGDLTNMYAVVKNSSGTIVAQPSPLGTVGATDNNFSINYTLIKNQNLTVELYANLADDGSDSAIDAADSFKTDLTVTGTSMISGQAVNASGGDIDGQTVAYGAASITATQDAATPVASIVYDNQTVTSAAFKFAAVTSGYNVTDLTFTLADATNVQNVMLYDGSTLVATQPGAATVTFSGISWNVPSNTNKVLTVQLQLGTVGVGAGTAGASLLTTLTAFTAQSTSTGVSAAGTESNPAGNAMYAYAAVPMVSTNNTSFTSTLNAGTNTLAKFDVVANGGTVNWKKMIFTISRATTGAATLGTFKVWDTAGNTEVAGTPTVTDSSGDNDCADAADTSCTVAFVATNEQAVSGTKTYVLKATVGGTLTTDDYFATSIAQPSSFVASTDYTTVAGTSASLVWSDVSAASHDTTTTDWNNGYLVKSLPLDSQTLTK
jgi:hypothetical protein